MRLSRSVVLSVLLVAISGSFWLFQTRKAEAQKQEKLIPPQLAGKQFRITFSNGDIMEAMAFSETVYINSNQWWRLILFPPTNAPATHAKPPVVYVNPQQIRMLRIPE